MNSGKVERWDGFGIGLGLLASLVLWLLMNASSGEVSSVSYAGWVALGPLGVVIVQLAAVVFVHPPSRIVRISAPLAVLANVEDVCSVLYYPRSSTAGLGIMVAPAIGVMALLTILPIVWLVDWLYRAGIEPGKNARAKNGA